MATNNRTLGLGLLMSMLCLVSTDARARMDEACRVPRIREAPSIDGVLDEPAWRQAPAAGGFAANRSHDPARHATEFRLLYDRDALYVAVVADEPDLEGLTTKYPEEEDNIWWDDVVEVFVDPQATRVRYFQYILNANGDYDSGYTGDFAADIPAEVAAGRTGDAWTLEMRIPFSVFGQPPHLAERWGFNMTRARNGRLPGEDRELTLWKPVDGPMHGTPGRFGTIVFSSPPGEAPPREEPDSSVLSRLLDRIAREDGGDRIWSETDLPFEARAQRAERLVALYSLLGRFPEQRLLPFVRPAIRDEHILPFTVPLREEIGAEIDLTACRGEFESGTIGLFALHDLKNVRAGVSALRSSDGSAIPPDAADPYHVVCWYQGGSGSVMRGRTTLLAELLLKNPALVTIDPASRTNHLNFDPIPEDAAALQPIDIPAFESRQIWITWRVPAGTPKGVYRGEVEIRADGGIRESIPVTIRVPGWDLEPNPRLHGLYHGLRAPRMETAEDEETFFARVEAELRDQIEHGCNIVATYIGPGPLPSDPSPFATFQRIHDIQNRHHPGISTPFICIVTQIGFQQGDQLNDLTEQARRLEAWARANGRDGFYFHGMDEASGPALERERASFQAVRDGGAGVFVACRPSFFDLMGDVLNLPNVTGQFHPELARRVHALGHRILSYGNPQTGVEMPEVYRRKYGLALRAAGYDGSCNYAYMTVEYETSWDDFDEEHYRDHNFAYPAAGRPVDTIQFEGWREAVDDIRYAATLEKAIETAERGEGPVALAIESREYLDALTGYEKNLDAVRGELIRRIDLLLGE